MTNPDDIAQRLGQLLVGHATLLPGDSRFVQDPQHGYFVDAVLFHQLGGGSTSLVVLQQLGHSFRAQPPLCVVDAPMTDPMTDWNRPPTGRMSYLGRFRQFRVALHELHPSLHFSGAYFHVWF